VITQKRMIRKVTITTFEFAATVSQDYFQGGAVGLDYSTGLLDKMGASDTMVPIGLVVEDTEIGSGGGTVLVRLFDEASCVWFKGDAVGDGVVAADDVGKVAYYLDDETVSINADYNNNPEAGIILAVDSAKGVLVKVN